MRATALPTRLEGRRESLALVSSMSYETDSHPDNDVAAFDPLADASHYGRHRAWDLGGGAFKHRAVRPRGLAVRDARARRTAIGARHHAARRVVRRRHARHAHEGGTLPRDREIHWRLLLRLDTVGAWRARGLHRHPRGARTVELAMASATISSSGDSMPRTCRKLSTFGKPPRRTSTTTRLYVNWGSCGNLSG